MIATMRRNTVLVVAFVLGWGLAGAAVAVGATEPAGACLSGRSAPAVQHKCDPDDDDGEERWSPPAGPLIGERPQPLP